GLVAGAACLAGHGWACPRRPRTRGPHEGAPCALADALWLTRPTYRRRVARTWRWMRFQAGHRWTLRQAPALGASTGQTTSPSLLTPPVARGNRPAPYLAVRDRATPAEHALRRQTIQAGRGQRVQVSRRWGIGPCGRHRVVSSGSSGGTGTSATWRPSGTRHAGTGGDPHGSRRHLREIAAQRFSGG